MNERLKFRVWDGIKLVYIPENNFENISQFLMVHGYYDIRNKRIYQQFTGLKDKNGIEICKSNADHLLGMIIDGVTAKFPEAKIMRTRKPSAAIGATAEVLAELERETDVVIAAMAD